MFNWLLILQQDTLDVKSEQDLITASFEWAKRRSEKNAKNVSVSRSSIRNELGFVLQQLRFLTLTPAEFVAGPAKSDILTESEKLAILMNLITPGTSAIPETICTNKSKRLIPVLKPVSELGYFRKYQRIISSRKNFKQTNEDTITFYLKCNFTVWIQGFEIASQIRSLKEKNSDDNKKYYENISIQLERREVDDTFEAVGEAEVKGEVDYKSTMDFKFGTPVLAKAGQELTAHLRLQSRGVYASARGPRTVARGQIVFTFRTEHFEPQFDNILEAVYYFC